MLARFREGSWHGRIEMTAVFLFSALSLMALILAPHRVTIPTTTEGGNNQISALASAMPHQGWAPLTVYFSAFGSKSRTNPIVKYEWDLDGNGLYDTNATNQNGYIEYTYAKPGEYPISLRVTDSLGQTAVDSLLVRVRHPASSVVDYWTVFDDSQVRKVTIETNKTDWDRMWVDPEAKLEIPASAIIFGEKLEPIGFRMRGQFSLRESGLKKPWKINTDLYIEGLEFHNLKQLMFINAVGDPSLIQEKLTYDMLSFAGVPASQVCFVDVWIDFRDDNQPAEFWGVYNLIERVDRKFLANHFGQDFRHGNLYKASHAQRGPMDLIYYGDRIEDYPTQNGQYAYGKMTNVAETDYNDIIELARIVDGTIYKTPEDFVNEIEKVFNVDTFLRYMAVMVSVASWDFYPYTGNNFFLYHNPYGDRFELIPWDQTWGNNPQQPLFEREGFGLLERAPLYDQIFRVPSYRQQYAAYLDLLNRNWFNESHMRQQILYFHNQIAPHLIQSSGDKMYFGEGSMFRFEDFESSGILLADFIRQRSQFISQQLEQNR